MTEEKQTTWKAQGEMTITPIPDGQAIRSLKYQIYTESGKFKHIATVFDKGHAEVIAAAPELLAYAECEEAVSKRQDYAATLERHGWDGLMSAGSFIVELRRAAIAKATGKAA